MRIHAASGLFLAAFFAGMPAASADAPVVATFVNTQATNNCPAPQNGQLGYKCSFPKPGATTTLTLNAPANTTLPDGRVVQLLLQNITEGNPRRFKIVASHRPPGGAAFIPLADISAKQGEPIHFRFPYGGAPGDAMLVDITLAK
jgi:hypothetical protein